MKTTLTLDQSGALNWFVQFKERFYSAGASDIDVLNADDPFAEYADRVPNEASVRAIRQVNNDEGEEFDTFEEYLAHIDAL